MNDYKLLIRKLKELDADVIIILGHIKQAADAIEQLVKERDAAVKDLRTICQHYNIANICETCKRSDVHCCVCEWEWRGAQE